jgi:hypothetical protein
MSRSLGSDIVTAEILVVGSGVRSKFLLIALAGSTNFSDQRREKRGLANSEHIIACLRVKNSQSRYMVVIHKDALTYAKNALKVVYAKNMPKFLHRSVYRMSSVSRYWSPTSETIKPQWGKITRYWQLTIRELAETTCGNRGGKRSAYEHWF